MTILPPSATLDYSSIVIISQESSRAECIRGAKEVKGMTGILCSVCNKEDYLQKIGWRYFRIRHYDKIIDGKSTFFYHQVSEDYVERMLTNIKQFNN
jgi:hydroxyacyl-ACP dehydratase HTD2-like protein with hotdog domain